MAPFLGSAQFALELEDDRGLTVEVKPGDGGAAVSVSGEIDMASAMHLEQALTAVMAGCENRGLIMLDLSAVRFCDCSGLNVLLRARHAHRLLVVTAASRPVTRLLEVTGTAALFGGGVTTVGCVPARRDLPDQPDPDEACEQPGPRAKTAPW
ncbi:STAS domain-containing protein [Streptomyces sp. NPDC007369]|uniref:STAS domain-containing protein n=1 Tax=Streptomyces sp. NPDC007369 TaxID=3154589 RepID=UPI0033CBD8A7